MSYLGYHIYNLEDGARFRLFSIILSEFMDDDTPRAHYQV